VNAAEREEARLLLAELLESVGKLVALLPADEAPSQPEEKITR